MIMQTLRMQKLLTQTHGGYRVLVCREERVKQKMVIRWLHFIHLLVGYWKLYQQMGAASNPWMS